MSKIEKIAKTNEEQAVASWIDYLNGVRIENLMKSLEVQDLNLENAINTINDTFTTIKESIIKKNRGGTKGLHGFVAEIAECGVTNARNEIKGKAPNCIWVNDNGPSDLIRDGIEIQQKFVASGNHLSLQAIKQHYEKYPHYIDGNRKYQIPADHYEKIKKMLALSKDEANKMGTQNGDFSLKQWKDVHDFFSEGKIKIDDIEPSKLAYEDVQAGKIENTLDEEKIALVNEDSDIRGNLRKKYSASLKEGVKVVAVSSVVEGGGAFVSEILKRNKEGKRIKEFSSDDWVDIANKTGISVLKGGIRGASVYAMTNCLNTPASIASAFCTAIFGVSNQIYLYNRKIITYEQFLLSSERICTEVSISAVASLIGQMAIPVPVLGAIVGNTVGNIIYEASKKYIDKANLTRIKGYFEEIASVEEELDDKYILFVSEISDIIMKFYDLLQLSFSPNIEEAFEGSIKLAYFLGVNEDLILKDINEIDNYFM